MKKIDSLRRYLLGCFTPSTTTTTKHTITHTSTKPTTTTTTKKRFSTSLRDDIPPPPTTTATTTTTTQDEKQRNRVSHHHHQENEKQQEEEEEKEEAAECLSTDYDDEEEGSVNNYHHHHHPPPTVVPPRSSRSMVIGTIFGHRRGHVSFCIQHDRLDSRPSLLLDFSIPTQLLVKEMSYGLVRIALECSNRNTNDLSYCSLHSVPVWTMCMNGRKVGYATKRRANDKDRMILKTMKSTTVGAGVIPAEMARKSSVSADHHQLMHHHHHHHHHVNNGSGGVGGEGLEQQDIGGELIYMRANYERVIGGLDTESYHLLNPGGAPGHELSVFLLRSR